MYLHISGLKYFGKKWFDKQFSGKDFTKILGERYLVMHESLYGILIKHGKLPTVTRPQVPRVLKRKLHNTGKTASQNLFASTQWGKN